jgi:hypothetical protein
MRRSALLAVGAGTVLLLTVVAPARAQSGADLVAACRANGGSEQECRGIEHLEHTAGVVCRDAATNNDACATVDGTIIDEEAVKAAEHSWLARALAYQRALDDNLPLQEELWTHTHNSFNADVYPPTFYGIDRNQIYSITDQLRMGIRAIEIDVHWFYSPRGDPANNFKAVVVCHGGIPPPSIATDHFGCGVNDPLFADRLKELRAWLNANRDEVVMLFLENNLGEDKTAHDVAAKAIADELGELLVYKPATSCAELPMDSSRDDIRDSGDTGKQVIITGDCDSPGSAWGDWVHVRGPKRWIEGGLVYGDDYPAYPACNTVRESEHYERNWIRHWGDETGLSDGAGEGGDTSVADARNMVRCGVNMIGYDNLVPFDPRLEAVVWSWAKDEPIAANGSCAHEGADGRFHTGGCMSHKAFACITPVGDWIVAGPAGAWDKGTKRCEHAGATFAVPRTGYYNELLKDAKGAADVWLDYRP